eukprot:s1803_g10.t1
MDMRIIVAIVAFALPSMAEFSAAFHQLTAVRRSWWPTPWSWYSGIQFQQGKIAQLARAMLMRNPTRIEFKVEDAQEYIRNRERQKRPNQGQTCTLPPVPGASAGRLDDSGAQSILASSPSVEERMRDMMVDESAIEEAPQRSSDSFEPPPRDGNLAEDRSFQSEVEQLTVLGISEQEARRALRATGGDLEAAADRLLL